MPSHKKLKSVVRSVVDQFTSSMNYVDGDYVMGHLLSVCRSTGVTTLEVDLLTGRASPPQLLVEPVIKSIARYAGGFRRLVQRSGSDIAFVKAAAMSVRFDTSVTRSAQGWPAALESPYRCEVTIIDDRGKPYTAVVTGWWFPENLALQPLWSRLRAAFSRIIARWRAA